MRNESREREEERVKEEKQAVKRELKRGLVKEFGVEEREAEEEIRATEVKGMIEEYNRMIVERQRNKEEKVKES